MARKVFILVGTKKGAFIIESDAERRSWKLRGPFCETWPMNHVIADPATGTIYGGGGNEWFGPAVWKSTDVGATWTHSSEGLAYQAGEAPIKAVWSVAPAAGSLYAGVEPAGPAAICRPQVFVQRRPRQSPRAVLGIPHAVRDSHVLRPEATSGLVGIERAAQKLHRRLQLPLQQSCAKCR